jgi:hypothetical protein
MVRLRLYLSTRRPEMDRAGAPPAPLSAKALRVLKVLVVSARSCAAASLGCAVDVLECLERLNINEPQTSSYRGAW